MNEERMRMIEVCTPLELKSVRKTLLYAWSDLTHRSGMAVQIREGSLWVFTEEEASRARDDLGIKRKRKGRRS